MRMTFVLLLSLLLVACAPEVSLKDERVSCNAMADVTRQLSQEYASPSRVPKTVPAGGILWDIEPRGEGSDRYWIAHLVYAPNDSIYVLAVYLNETPAYAVGDFYLVGINDTGSNEGGTYVYTERLEADERCAADLGQEHLLQRQNSTCYSDNDCREFPGSLSPWAAHKDDIAQHVRRKTPGGLPTHAAPADPDLYSPACREQKCRLSEDCSQCANIKARVGNGCATDPYAFSDICRLIGVCGC